MAKQIYYGGEIVTMAAVDAETETYPEALVVSDGHIAYVGALDEAKTVAGGDAELIDLAGKTLLPAFIDGHSHISMAAQMGQGADLSDCESYEDIVRTLKAFLAENEITEDELLVGFGYDHNFLKEGGHPTREVLDQVSATIPIYVSHVSGHMGCTNSAGLALAGIDHTTPSPEGGMIGRMEGSDEPNGYLEEAGMMALQRVLPGRMKIDMMKGLKKAQENYLKYGVTTVQDGASSVDTIKLLAGACANGVIDVDVVAYPLCGETDAEEIFQTYGDYDEKYKEHLKLGGYKLVLDGSPQGKSAWLTQPYENSGDYCGYPWMPDEKVESFMEEALKNHRQILVHCNGDAAGDQFLNAYEKALKKYPGAASEDLRPVMIHCQTARDDQLARMKEMDMIPSVFVGHVYYWGDVHVKNLGEARGSRVSPCRSALAQGLIMNFHQDTPVTKPDMMHSVWTAVNRITRGGRVIGEEQRIGVYEAMKAITIQAAYAYHEEGEKGSLETGKRADLVIMETNPLKADKMSLKDIRVMETIKEGKTLYKREA